MSGLDAEGLISSLDSILRKYIGNYVVWSMTMMMPMIWCKILSSKHGTFRGESKISTWLYRIAMHEGLNFLKQEQRKQTIYMRADDDDTASFFIERLEADGYFDGDDYEKSFQKAILTLPEKQQQVFRMRYYDDLSYEDIAKITGTSVGALKASYHHATKKLENILGEE